uniref:Uncharacterized protein n=1 Tax=Hucho hucho TaxID=62062 RepID=A0A4W5PY75_9TELE
MEATVFMGTFNPAELFWYPSPDLWLDTILSQRSTDNSFDLMPCHAGETCVNPCYNSHDYTNHQQQHVNATLVTMLGSSTQTTVHLAGPCWGLYLNPILSLILLQTVPKQTNMHRLLGRVKSLDGVLAGAGLFPRHTSNASYMDVAKQIKGLFHEEGIHATTVQPKFITVNFCIYMCELSCRTQCAPKLCCGSFDRTALRGPVGEEVVSSQYHSIQHQSTSIQHQSTSIQHQSTSIQQSPFAATIKLTATQSPKPAIYTEAESSL